MTRTDPPGGSEHVGWHSYRCPVCGHTDEGAMDGEGEGTVVCSHCATSLDLIVQSPDQAPVAVRVASRWRKGR